MMLVYYVAIILSIYAMLRLDDACLLCRDHLSAYGRMMLIMSRSSYRRRFALGG
jgi:hypothetical protein